MQEVRFQSQRASSALAKDLRCEEGSQLPVSSKDFSSGTVMDVGEGVSPQCLPKDVHGHVYNDGRGTTYGPSAGGGAIHYNGDTG